jgi:hypothetical protein
VCRAALSDAKAQLHQAQDRIGQLEMQFQASRQVVWETCDGASPLGSRRDGDCLCPVWQAERMLRSRVDNLIASEDLLSQRVQQLEVLLSTRMRELEEAHKTERVPAACALGCGVGTGWW